MKHSEEYNNFTNLVDNLLTVSHEEMQNREAEYRKQVDANPHRRGPKRGSKKRKAATPPSASDHESHEEMSSSDSVLRCALLRLADGRRRPSLHGHCFRAWSFYFRPSTRYKSASILW
jgi:hypothetical protein